MKRLIVKNKRKIWLLFLLIVFLILACRAAYITGNRVGRQREKEEENKVESVVRKGINEQMYETSEMEELC